MKRMKMSALARGNLKGKRRQYLTLFFGVFFAMLFSMSTLFFVSSFRASVQAKNEWLYGKEKMILTNATHEDWSGLDQFFTEPTYGFAHVLGLCDTDMMDEFNEPMSYAIGWLDETAKELSGAELKEGSYPAQADEIAIEETALKQLHLEDVKIGDEIELRLRVQSGSGYLQDAVTQRFTLTGILLDKAWYVARHFENAKYAIPALHVAPNTPVAPGGKENLCAYLHFQKQLFDDHVAFFSFIGGGENLIPVYHMTGNDFDASNGLLPLYIVLTIFAVSLLLVSCVGIVNAFRSRLDDRKTQIGLLRAVGTTRRQVVKLYSRETLLLCLLATPPAFLGAFFGVRALIGVIADGLIFTPQWWVLIGSAAVSVLVVLLASLIPLRRASRISPMQAIRNTEMTRTMANKKIRSQIAFDVPSLLAKRSRQLFKKRRALTAIMLTVSVLVAAFGFTMVGMFATQQPWKDGDYQLYCTSSAYGDLVWERGQKHGWTASELAEIQHISGITSASGWGSFPALIETDALTEYDKMLQLNLSLNLEEIEDLRLTPDMLTHFVPSASVERLKEQGKYRDELLPVTVVYTSDTSVYQNLPAVREGKVDLDALDAGKEMLLYAPSKLELRSRTCVKKNAPEYGAVDYLIQNADRTYIESKDFKTETLAAADGHFHAGDTLPLSVLYSDWVLSCGTDEAYRANAGARSYSRKDKPVAIGVLLQEPIMLNVMFCTDTELILYTTVKGLAGFADRLQYSSVKLFADQNLDEAADERITQQLDRFADGQSDTAVFSRYQFNQTIKQDTRMSMFAVLSICLVFFTMAGSLINNEFTSRIRSGKRQIGTLRAVGASQQTLVASYRKELLWLFAVSFGTGTVLYIAFNPIFYRLMEGQWKGFLLTPWVLLAVAGCALLALICTLNLHIQLRRLTKDSIVDNIREMG